MQWIFPLLGWSLNQKCDFSPSTFKKFLGFYIDSENMRLKAPFRKVREITDLVADAIAARSCSLERLQSVAGKIIALKLAVPGTRAWTRSTNNLIASSVKSGVTPEQLIPIPDEVAEDLGFLLTHIPSWSTIGLPLPSAAIDVSVSTDAGEFGYGGHTENLRPNLEYAGSLPPEAIGRSSNREFVGLHGVAYQFRNTLRDKRVLFRLDSRCLVCNLYKEGGKIPDLYHMWQKWFEFCVMFNIEPYYEWLPREENARADKLSKRVPIEWVLTPTARTALEAGLPANHALRIVLPDLNQYANCLKAAKDDGDSFILVHPVWPAMAWWHFVSSACTLQVALPPANISLAAPKGDGKRMGPRHWRMRASLLRF